MNDFVTIKRDELEALRAVVAAAEKARAEIKGPEGWTDSLDEIWDALGELYRVRPALRPSGVARPEGTVVELRGEAVDRAREFGLVPPVEEG